MQSSFHIEEILWKATQEYSANIYPLHSNTDTFVIAQECVTKPILLKFNLCVLCKLLIFQFTSETVPAPSPLKLNMFLPKSKAVALEFNNQKI